MNIIDILEKSKRGPAVILPKDAAAIVANTGVTAGWKVVEAGGGSGFLTMFLSNLGCQVYTYEIQEKFYDIVKRNLKKSGLKAKLYNKDITRGIKEKDVDLVTLDMKGPERVIPLAHKALKKGGFISVYSMHVEQMKKVMYDLEKHGFENIKSFETIQIEWQSVNNFTRPKTWLLGHTGYLIFGRKP